MQTPETKRLRIGIVCYPTHGGSGVVAVELAHVLAARGHDVHVISYAVPIRLDPLRPRIHFHKVTVPDYPLFEYPPYSLALAAKLAEVICEHSLDVLHVHYAIPHATSAWMARKIAKRNDLPIITTLHGTDITIVGNDPSYLPVTRLSLEISDAVTVVSNWLSQQVNEMLRCECGATIVYNGIDTKRFHPDAAKYTLMFDRYDSAPVLMHISNFRPVKRVMDVVNTYLKIRETMAARLVMVGDGPDRLHAETTLKQSPYAQDVLFIDPVPKTNRILPLADLFLFPSNAESFGLVALEAMACGVPILGAEAGGLPEVVRHGIDGVLCPPGDIDCFAEEAVNLLSDTKRRETMEANCVKRATTHFQQDYIVNQYEAIYHDSLERIRKNGPKDTDSTSLRPCDSFPT